jgi:hypothetical protein
LKKSSALGFFEGTSIKSSLHEFSSETNVNKYKLVFISLFID